MISANKKISEILQDISKFCENDKTITLRKINDILADKGLPFLMILFSFPMAIPLPYPPGFTTILGLPILLYSLQMMRGKNTPWLPEKIANKEIQVAHLNFAINKSLKFFHFVEKLSKVRCSFMFSPNMEKFIGFIAFLCAISIVLPIMFGNAVPSLGVLIMAIGLLNKDGLTVIIGIITSIIGLFISTIVVVFGIVLIQKAIAYLMAFIGL